MLTGQWGEDITTTTQGSFVDKTYIYTIPAYYNDVTAVLRDLEIAAFVAEGNQEIISGVRAEPSFVNLNTDNNTGIEKVVVAEKICGNTVIPSVKIRNNGNNNLTSADISFNVNDGTDSVYHWTGNLGSLKFIEFDLSEYEFTPQQTNSLNVEISSISGGADEDASDNSITGSFDKSAEANNLVTLSLTTDQYAHEISWKLYNSSGSIVESGSAYSNNSTITETFHLDLDCYVFEIIDSYGDGGAIYNLKDSDGLTIHSSNGNYGKGEKTPFKAATEVQTYNVTFTVIHGTDLIEGAEVSLTNHGSQTTNNSGIAIFNNVYPQNDIAYTINITGYDEHTDYVTVVDVDVDVDANIQLTGINNLETAVFNMYPNPVCDVLTLDFELEKPANVKIKLYNSAGNLIKIQTYGKTTSGKNNFEISVSELKPGTYYLILDADNKLVRRKITVIR